MHDECEQGGERTLKTPTIVTKVLSGLEDVGFIGTEEELQEYIKGQRGFYENPDPFLSLTIERHYPTFTSWMADKMLCSVFEASLVIQWADNDRAH